MKEAFVEKKDGLIRIRLSGHIDSNNAEEIKSEIFAQIGEDTSSPVFVDAEHLEYISSAGLRILLQLRKNHPEMHIADVSPEVYEILDVTGFTQMMDVTRAYRSVSIEGAEVIGRGANGTVYRIDQDSVVKVYNDPDSIDDIQHEREVARLALILGIPTAISFDIVKVGDSYGSVFELLNASSFASILANEPERIDWCVCEYVKLLKKIHSTVVPEGKLPAMKDVVTGWADFMQDYLPEETGAKLEALVAAIPPDNHMIHGDYHTKNVVLTEDDVLLIDMDTLAVGDPVLNSPQCLMHSSDSASLTTMSSKNFRVSRMTSQFSSGTRYLLNTQVLMTRKYCPLWRTKPESSAIQDLSGEPSAETDLMIR